jgi:hypothetical protein
MFDFLYGHSGWREEYSKCHENKRKIWIYIKLANSQELYLKDYKQWLSIEQYLNLHNTYIVSIGLRYRSQIVERDVSDAEFIYLVRSIKGQFGSVSRECFTIGKVKGDIIYKEMWMVPELIIEEEYKDTLENCFKEALINNDRQRKTSTI